jgi:hypothetical protein
MPSKESVRTGHELLMRWCTATATATNAVAHPLFDEYVLHVSSCVSGSIFGSVGPFNQHLTGLRALFLTS